jgi:Fibronectin type III domain
MSNFYRIGSACILFLVAASYAHAQTVRVPSPQRSAAPTALTGAPAPGEVATPTVPLNLRVTGGSGTEIDLTWDASTESGGTITMYRIYSSADGKCDSGTKIDTSPTTSYSVTGLTPNTLYAYCVSAVDANNKETDLSKSKGLSVKTASSNFSCWPIPVRPHCMDFWAVNDVDRKTKIYSNINSFYQTSGSFSFFNQVKSIYNGASGSATVSADLATLNFSSGMQITVATNVQAGSSGTTSVSSGTVPTLAANGAGQATQNILYGGTFVVSELYPLFAAGASKWGSPGGVGLLVDSVAKEGADVQNFKSGTNVNVTSPPFHGSGQIEGYLQYNSINLAPNSQLFAGSLFLGGSYGYDYMSRGYARDYGFGNQINNGIGQISFGILINGVAKITVSRAFGPSQTYIDSTTKAQTTVNNFKAWSFGIAYQTPSPAK